MPSPSELERKVQEEVDKLVTVDSIAGDDDKGVVKGSAVDFTLGPGKEHVDQTDPMVHASRIEQLGEGAEGGGQRFNAGKLRMDLTPPEWEIALADVTTQGSKKYDERNWEKGMKWSAMVGCMKRHINKFLAGERYDGEEFDLEKGTTGCHHLAMVAWNALGLMSYDLRKIGENDLPKEVQLELFDRVNAKTSDMGVRFNAND